MSRQYKNISQRAKRYAQSKKVLHGPCAGSPALQTDKLGLQTGFADGYLFAMMEIRQLVLAELTTNTRVINIAKFVSDTERLK